MADIHRLPDERQVLQKASEWVARLQADDATAEDRVRFEAWRDAHPLHRRTFDELVSTWNRFAAKRPLVNAVTFGQLMNETAEQAEAGPVRARHRRSRVAWAAAVAGILVGFGLFAYVNRSPDRIYATNIGEHATVSLPDGSTLELDGDSEASVNFSARYRIVHLERGEAFFRVVHNPEWPFWVVGGDSWVRDVGTAFNVQLDPAGMRVTVSQGMVKVGTITPLLQAVPFKDAMLSHEPALSVLTAGHQAYLSGGAIRVQPLSAAELADAVSWHARTLYFENTHLSEVAQQLSRYTPLHLVVSGESARNLPVAGTFDGSPKGVATFLTMLRQGLGLTVHREAGQVIIASPDSPAH